MSRRSGKAPALHYFTDEWSIHSSMGVSKSCKVNGGFVLPAQIWDDITEKEKNNRELLSRSDYGSGFRSLPQITPSALPEDKCFWPDYRPRIYSEVCDMHDSWQRHFHPGAKCSGWCKASSHLVLQKQKHSIHVPKVDYFRLYESLMLSIYSASLWFRFDVAEMTWSGLYVLL